MIFGSSYPEVIELEDIGIPPYGQKEIPKFSQSNLD